MDYVVKHFKLAFYSLPLEEIIIYIICGQYVPYILRITYPTLVQYLTVPAVVML